MNERIEELESLLLDWETGTLGEVGVERVREILRDDEQARSHFARMQLISAALKLDSDAGVGVAVLPGPEDALVQANPCTWSREEHRAECFGFATWLPSRRPYCWPCS